MFDRKKNWEKWWQTVGIQNDNYYQGCHLAFLKLFAINKMVWPFSNVDKNSIFQCLFWANLSKFQEIVIFNLVVLTFFWRKFGLYLAFLIFLDLATMTITEEALFHYCTLVTFKYMRHTQVGRVVDW